MKLVLDISALDRTNSAVTSVADTTPVTAIQSLVMGDSEPLDIKFTDSSASPPASPSWAGQAGYTPQVYLGTLDANALLNYATGASFQTQTGGWTGRIALNSSTLQQAMIMGTQLGGGWVNVATDPRSRNARPSYSWFWLQIKVLDPSNNPVSYALVRVPVLNRIF